MEYIRTTNSTECFMKEYWKQIFSMIKICENLQSARLILVHSLLTKYMYWLNTCLSANTYKVHNLRLSTDNGEVVKVVVEVDSIVSFIDNRPNSYKNTLTIYITLNVSTFNNSIAEAVFKKKNHIYLSCMVISIIEEGPYNQIIYQVILFGFAEFQEMSAEDTSYFWHWTVL